MSIDEKCSVQVKRARMVHKALYKSSVRHLPASSLLAQVSIFPLQSPNFSLMFLSVHLSQQILALS